jgi:hypothetical protein
MAQRRTTSYERCWHRLAGIAALLGVLNGAMATPCAVSGQSGKRTFGIGYVANAPDLMGGGSGYAVFPVLGGLGVYVDAKVDLGSPAREDTFLSTLTAAEVEATVAGVEFISAEDSWRSFNIALVRPVTPALTLYGGAGYARRTRYRQYRDPEGEMGLLGFFWVEAPDEEWNTVNGLVGGYLRMSRWIDFQFGLETTPRGFTVGASLRLPPR